jgi:type IV pilus assembly protein PilO
VSATTVAQQPIATVSLAQRVRAWLSPLNLHWAGVGLLALVNLYLLAQMGLLWRAASSHDADAMAQQRIALHTAEIAAQPLRGLDAKLAQATSEADKFYERRLPGTYSEIAAELGTLTKAQKVRLTGVSYGPTAKLAGSPYQLTEVRMDARLSGDYRPLVQFINSLERDKTFFIIRTLTLTGQQTGAVNLRLGLTTYLRGDAIGSAPTGAAVATRATGGTGR